MSDQPPSWQPVHGEPYAPVPADPYQGQWQQPVDPWHQAPQPWQQPYAPYSPAYPGYGFDPRTAGRPGTLMASAVLAYVTAGLLILAGALLLFGASVVSNLDEVSHSAGGYGAELAFDGVLNFLAAGLLIGGGVMVTGRKAAGRTLLSVGSVIVLGETVYWMVRFDFLHANGAVIYAVLFGALAVLILAFAWTAGARTWLMAGRP